MIIPPPFILNQFNNSYYGPVQVQVQVFYFPKQHYFYAYTICIQNDVCRDGKQRIIAHRAACHTRTSMASAYFKRFKRLAVPLLNTTVTALHIYLHTNAKHGHKFACKCRKHYSNVKMGAMASQITRVSIVYPIVCSGSDQIKHQSSASLAFVRGIHRSPVNSPHTWPVTRKMFPFDDVIMKG